jgi:ABC-type uncharacterized transport system permease subunit
MLAPARFARWRAALVALAAAFFSFAPVAALAQANGAPAEPGRADRGFGWLWLLAAVLVVVALARMFFTRPRSTLPPPNRP